MQPRRLGRAEQSTRQPTQTRQRASRPAESEATSLLRRSARAHGTAIGVVAYRRWVCSSIALHTRHVDDVDDWDVASRRRAPHARTSAATTASQDGGHCERIADGGGACKQHRRPPSRRRNGTERNEAARAAARRYQCVQRPHTYSGERAPWHDGARRTRTHSRRRESARVCVCAVCVFVAYRRSGSSRRRFFRPAGGGSRPAGSDVVALTDDAGAGPLPRRSVGRMDDDGSYLVDPASSHMLVSKIKPCTSKYILVCKVKLRMAH